MDEQADQSPRRLKEFSSDRFENASPIGGGRNATVYRAWDNHLERQVAFKRAEDPFADIDVADVEALFAGQRHGIRHDHRRSLEGLRGWDEARLRPTHQPGG
ncbi:hypothetical protein ENSA7_43130 [Enhygromyxa salina]|uniref:Protein kinase domain-containing protein n=1 Tax=Enhygromyxa salina TaxID=215803 RepID=A0A2S9YLT2_9BACT|nr:hypothetical protein ENSA7_43130 [Enhygromyxa salina]